MKYCPTCNISYADDSQQFCFQDGTMLIAGGPDADTPTVVLDETETMVHGSSPNWQGGPAPQTVPLVSPVPPPSSAKNSNTFIAVLLTVLIMLVIFGFAGVGIWAYLNSPKNERTENGGRPVNSNRDVLPSPTKALPTPSPSNDDSDTEPAVDPEVIKSEVQKKIYRWKSLSEARDLTSNLENYADQVDYYLKKNASRDFIRGDKQRASSLYDTIRINITNLRITPDSGGKKATAVFDKEWEFTGPGKYSTGKVHQQLQLEKINAEWLITAEKDLKLYYKN